MDFPDVFDFYEIPKERTSFTHPDFKDNERVTDVILKKDVLFTNRI